MKEIPLILFLLVVPFMALAQDSDEGENLSLDKLEVNNSPSLMLFDDAPTTMDRRNGGCAFVYNQYNGSNFSAAVSPYWYLNHNIKNRSALSFAGVVVKNEESETPEYRMSPLAGLKLITLSGAFITKDNTVLDAAIHSFAIGAQANIISIYPKGHANKLVKQQEQIKDVIFDLNEYLLDEYYEKFYKKYKNSGVAESEIVAKVNRDIDSMKTVITSDEIADKLRSKFITEINNKPMISLDGAVGYSMFFLNNDYDNRHPGRMGAWLTAAGSVPISKDLGQNYSNASYINFYVLGKYITDQMSMNAKQEFVKQDLLDYGGKIEVQFSRLSFGYEFVKRTSSATTLDSYRSSGVLQLKVQDNLYLTTALGKSFGKEDNLIALFGLNWNIQRERQRISTN